MVRDMSGQREDRRAPGDAPAADDRGDAGWVEHDPASIHRDFMPESAYVPDERAIDPALEPPPEADWGAGETPPHGTPGGDPGADWFAGDAPKAAQVKARRGEGPPPPSDAGAWLDAEDAPTVTANPPRPLPGAPMPPAPTPPPRAPEPAAKRPEAWSGGGPRAVHVPRGQQGRGPELGADPRRVALAARERGAAPAAAAVSARRRKQRQAMLSLAGTVLVVAGATAGLWYWRQPAESVAAPTVQAAPPPTAPVAERPKERPPAVVRSNERLAGSEREYTRVKARPAPARFVSAETGEVLCESAEACSVPADETIRVEAKGREPQILEPKALGAHAGGELVVALPPAKP